MFECGEFRFSRCCFGHMAEADIWKGRKSKIEMIDIHAHILPGVDDGAPDWDTALKMAQLAVNGGVTGMAVTPHCNTRYRNFQSPELTEHINRFRDLLQQYHISLNVYAGMEIMGSIDMGERLRDGVLATLNGSRYPLVEFHFTGTGREETDILDSLLQFGYRPVVAHPERYRYVQEEPELLNVWFEMGCLLQINRGSLMGRFGDGAAALAYAMVEREFAAVVASDAHSHVWRTPYMADVRDMLSQQFSPQKASALLRENPARILQNREISMKTPAWF